MATRHERVIIELDDRFTRPMAQMAASTSLFRREVKGIGGDADDIERSTARAEKSIDKLSGRLSLMAEVAATLGPGLIPIGAVGIPAFTGLASSMGFAALAGGTVVAAFQGVGDALEALNKAQMEPTTANLDAAREAMANISPEAQALVRNIRTLLPELRALRDTAAAGMFPGLNEGIDSLEKGLPKVERIVAAISGELGDIAAESGKSLAGPRWDDFFTFLATEAPQALSDTAQGVGNVSHALAELWMAFSPLNRDFSSWLVDATKGLDDWATGLSKTDGFQEFVEYIRANGPQVGETIAAMANAVLQIVEAAAPLGGPVLQGLEAVAKAIAAVADSDLGTPIFTALAALTLYNRALAVTGSLSQKTFGSGPLMAGINGQRTALRGMVADYRAVGVAQKAQLVAQREYEAAAATYSRRLQTMNTMQSRPDLFSAPSTRQRARVDDSLVQVQKTSAAAAAATERVTRAEKAKSVALREGAASAGKAAALMTGLAVATTGAGDSIGVTNTTTLGLAGTMGGPWGVAAGVTIGALLDIKARFDDVNDAATGARAALATGEIDAMTKSYDRLHRSMAEASKFKPQDLLPPVGVLGIANQIFRRRAQQNQADAGAQLTGGINSVAALSSAQTLLRAQGLLAKGMNLTSTSARKQAAALGAARNAAAQTGGAFTGLGADVNNAKVSLDGWLKQLEDQNAALRGFATNSIRAAQRGLRDGLIKQLQAAGPEGALRLKQLANATDAEIGRANRAFVRGRQAVDQYGDAVEQNMTGARGKVTVFSGAIRSLPKRVQTEIKQNGLERTRAAVVDLTRRYKLTPKQVATLIREQGGRPTKAVVDAVIAAAQKLGRQRPNVNISARDNASGTINSVWRALNGLNGKTATTYVRTVRTSYGVEAQVRAGGRTGVSRASGGPVYASDGQSRGPRDDSIPAWLSHREWVQPVAAVDFYGERFMEDVRNRRLAKPQGYADGGPVQRFAGGGSVKRKKAKGSPGRLTRAERAKAAKQFDIGTIGLAATNRELDQFAKTINRSGGRVGRDFGRLSKQILSNATQYERNTKAIAALKEKQTSAREAGVGAFNNNIFGGSAKDLLTQLEADRNDARSSAAAIAAARTRGLSGDLAAGLAGSGNAALAAEFAQMSASQIASYQALYASRTSAQNSLGSQAAASYDAQLASLESAVRGLTAVQNRLEHAVERGARNGTAGKKRATTTKHKARG